MDWAGGWCWLDRYELEGHASEVLSFRSPTVCWTSSLQASPGLLRKPGRAGCRTATRYGVAVDVNRAADLYALGWTLRQIAAELNLTQSTVSEQLHRAGVTMRRGGPPAHPASTQQIVELRDQGLTWPEIAGKVDMTFSGAWSRYRRARPPKPPRLGRWQQVLADAVDQNLAIGVRAAVADHLGRAPTRAELTAARRAAHRRRLHRRIRRDQGVREVPPVSSSISHPDHDHSNGLPSRSRSRS
jgi:AraC-like DNA-binding protein